VAGPVVRFAPSPTGYLHIGGARTALYNWLLAKRDGGTFVLRIEDTDRQRSTDLAVHAIVEGLEWLGISWDEGPGKPGPRAPYRQTERLDVYREAAERLVGEGKAYYCTCTPETLDALRKEAEKAKRQFLYPGTCRGRSEKPDGKWVVRYRMAEGGTTVVDDLIHGRVEFGNDTIGDEVILRGNGIPLYNFGVVVDDLSMGVTLVVRGDDHLINTPRQVQMYAGLGKAPPAFAHVPLILGQDKKRLSKRQGAVSVLEYREAGYLPDALLNYLVRLGWSHGDQEIFSKDDLVRLFSLEDCGKTGGVWDPGKLQWMNGQYVKATPLPELARLVRPFLARIGIADVSEDALGRALGPARERAKTLLDLADAVSFYFREPEVDPKAAKFLNDETRPLLGALADVVGGVGAFEPADLEAAVTAWLGAKGIELKAIAQPARVALSGRTATPGLFEVMAALGKEKTLARLRRA
jgi:glutamyl-tRNA synthetase